MIIVKFRVQDYLQNLTRATELTIEAAFVEFYCSCRCPFVLGYLGQGDLISLESWISNYAFPNLKKVNVVSSTGVCLKRYDRVFKFLECLLKNAIVSEKFVIISRRRKCWLGKENCMSIYSRRLAKKLSDCPRSLTIIMPSFHESVDHD
uniref:Uncharacterized protein LOC104244546 n=1 Tax=Nicotiana sylvestris TaxID=4096 RepID=A0A1U7YGD0_NICSY|nr:PREDICTED: uncharacterized protein LOC104244546 [Nicotiana sylvestris]